MFEAREFCGRKQAQPSKFPEKTRKYHDRSRVRAVFTNCIPLMVANHGTCFICNAKNQGKKESKGLSLSLRHVENGRD
jgi:hypothetical protein